MLEVQIVELDRHLAAFAGKFGIVAIARATLRDGGDCLELRAAVWRNRRLEGHVQIVDANDLDRLGVSEVAERFIDHVNSLFPAVPAVANARCEKELRL